MAYEALVAALDDLRRELKDLQRQKAVIDSRVANLERTIEGIEGLRGPVPPPSPPLEGFAPEMSGNGSEPLRGIAAIRAVMKGSDRVWRAKEIHRALEERGWVSPHAKHPLRGTEAAINRLRHAGEIERIEPGRYRYKEEAPT